MDLKKLRLSALICLFFTTLWLILMIMAILRTGPLHSYEQAVNSVINRDIIFRLTYINAILVTVTATIFFTCLYSYCKSLNTEWSLIGLIFLPVYTLLNLFVYFSQITIVPELISLMSISEYSDIYAVILGQFIQGWSGSVISVLNQLAYAVLGIPSIIFGVMLFKFKKLSAGGLLLAFNGLSCIIGAIGTAADSQLLANGSVSGGVFFLMSLLIFALKSKPENVEV